MNYEVHLPHNGTAMARVERVRGHNWLEALRHGLEAVGLPAPTSNLSFDLQDDQSVVVTDNGSGQVYRVCPAGAKSTTSTRPSATRRWFRDNRPSLGTKRRSDTPESDPPPRPLDVAEVSGVRKRSLVPAAPDRPNGTDVGSARDREPIPDIPTGLTFAIRGVDGFSAPRAQATISAPELDTFSDPFAQDDTSPDSHRSPAVRQASAKTVPDPTEPVPDPFGVRHDTIDQARPPIAALPELEAFARANLVPEVPLITFTDPFEGPELAPVDPSQPPQKVTEESTSEPRLPPQAKAHESLDDPFGASAEETVEGNREAVVVPSTDPPPSEAHESAWSQYEAVDEAPEDSSVEITEEILISNPDEPIRYADPSPRQTDRAVDTGHWTSAQTSAPGRAPRQDPTSLADALDHDLAELPMLGADIGEVANFVLDATRRIVPCSAGAVLLIDARDRVLYFAAARGPQSSTISANRIPLDAGIASVAIQQRGPVTVRAPIRDVRYASSFADSLGYRPNSVMCAPLCAGKRVFGVIELLDRQQSDAFDDTDVFLLDRAAQHLGNYFASLLSPPR